MRIDRRLVYINYISIYRSMRNVNLGKNSRERVYDFKTMTICKKKTKFKKKTDCCYCFL